MYGGDIQGVGPRYCPSIEDKVVRFKGKERHPVFVEPCGEDTEEMYLQGMSSSLPEAVQNAMYRTIKGFENLEIMRPAYAIEYDCVDPTSMLPTLESKVIGGMYGAGQFNGTSGYEEAAAQGLLAGLNAARQALGKSELVLAFIRDMRHYNNYFDSAFCHTSQCCDHLIVQYQIRRHNMHIFLCMI